jgi:hypothetical protein
MNRKRRRRERGETEMIMRSDKKPYFNNGI